MAVNLISSEEIGITQTGSDIQLDLTGKTGDLVVDSIRTKNMFNKESITKGYVISSTGAINSGSGYCYSEYIPVKPNTQYTISRTFSGATGAEDLMRVAYYQSNKTFIDRPNSADRPWTITTPNNCYYIRLSYQYEYSGNASNTNIQVEEGSSATTYSPYQNLDANAYVLWSNSSLTSDFAGQQINLSDSLNNYTYYEILFLMSKHETIGVSTGKVNSAYSTSLMSLRSASTIGTISRYRDATRTTDTKIDFSACTECRGGATTVTTANDRIIPYKIIGYKY